MNKYALTLLCLLMISLSAHAQEDSPAPVEDEVAQQPAEGPSAPPTGCFLEGFHQFDFWLGSWDVYDMTSGELAGQNTIRVVEAGCAITENWLSVDGDTGRSTTSYNALTGRWYQIWIDPVRGGNMMDLEGQLYSDGSISLEGFLYNYGYNTAYPFRVRWYPDEDGSVRQYYERFDSLTQDWAYWWSARLVARDN